jgi:hypothetical protein
VTKDLKIVIRVDTKTGELKVLTNELDNVTAKANEAKSAFGSIKGKLLALGSAAASIYSISQAFGFVLSSGLEYNKQMDASRAKLRAMISSQKDYITLTGQKVSAMQREKLIAQELNATMTLLKRANAQTAMGMSELIDVYALAKPGMDRANWSLKDQIEILKLVTNTASNFGVSAEELSTGIDDLATGTWDATSGFGKMMKALGITNESFKAAANKVEFLKEKLKETGAMQDTWAVATSNLGVAWDELTGKITAPIFDIAKEGVKELTLYLNGIDSSSVDGVRDSLIELAKAGVTAAAYIKTFWDGVSLVFTVAQVAYYKFGLVVNEGMQNFSEISANVINAVYGYWIGFKNKVKHIWHDIVKYAADVWNGLLESISNSKFGKFIAQKFDISLGGLKIDIAPVNDDPIKDIVKAEDFSAGIDYYKRALISAKNEEFDKYNSLLNKDNFKAADEFIAKIDKIAQKYKDVKKEQDKTINGLQLANKKVSTKGLDDTAKKAKKASSSLKKLKSSAKSAKEQLAGLKEAKDTLFEATHSKSEAELKKLNEEMQKLGKYLDKSDIDKIYQAKLRRMQGFTKEFTDDFKTAFNSMLSGDIKGGIEGLFKSLSTKLINPLITNVSNSINSWFSSLTGNMGMFEQFGMGGLLAIGGSLLSGLFSGDKLTQAEIDAAKGRVDFSDKSLQKLGEYLENVENPLLPYTKRMAEYLQAMKDSFSVIGRELTGKSVDFDVTGVNYVPTQTQGFLGFSSETRDLIDAGIVIGATYTDYSKQFGNISSFGSFSENDLATQWTNLVNRNNWSEGYIDFGNLDSFKAYGYQTEKVTSSSFWGLFSDEDIEETTKELGSKTTQQFINVLKSGYDSIVDSAAILGYNVSEELSKVKIELGKISLKGLSRDEITERLNDAFSEVFSEAIGQISIGDLAQKYQHEGEELMETLGRIATEFEQASFTLENAGFKFEDTIKEQTVKFTGLFGELINKTFEVTLQDTYTAQEKILDIVEASGGLEKFNTNFSSFINNFYTDEEKLKLQENSLSSQFSSLNIALPKTEDEFKNLVQSFEVVDESSAKAWASLLGLSDSFKEYSDLKKQLEDEALEEQKNRLQDLISWQKDINKKISDAWMGSLSYLSSAEKEIKAKEIAEAYLLSGDVTSYLDMRAKELEFSRTKSSTQEEYAIAFNRYINDVKNAKQDSSTLDDVVKSIDELKEELAKLQNENNQIASNSSINTIKKLDALIEAEKETKKAIEDERVVV